MITARSVFLFSRPFHGLRLGLLPIPAMNRWAIFDRLLTRTQGPLLFCGTPSTATPTCWKGFWDLISTAGKSHQECSEVRDHLTCRLGNTQGTHPPRPIYVSFGLSNSTLPSKMVHPI